MLARTKLGDFQAKRKSLPFVRQKRTQRMIPCRLGPRESAGRCGNETPNVFRPLPAKTFRRRTAV